MQPSPDNSSHTDGQKTALDIGLKLDQILQAILPLHELLKAKETAEQGLTERLKQILESFANIAVNLETAARALTKLSETDQLPTAEAKAFRSLEEKIALQDARIEMLHRDLQTIMSWLSTPMDRSPERR